MPEQTITRHYVAVGGRQVHYRRSGEGPPVVLLHSSPQSSAFVVPVMRAISGGLTAIALDTPGYGESDPLVIADPSAADYADASLEAIDALGIGRCGLYGTHTGAHIALEVARRHAQRVAVLILDGISAYTAEERAEMLANYTPPFEPRADGGHLPWAWQHTRDQVLFYPWFRWEKAHRLDADMANADYIHEVVLAKMAAGDGYRTGYRAAFSHVVGEAIAEVEVPTVVLGKPGDILTPQQARLREFKPDIKIVALASEASAWGDALRSTLAKTALDEPTPPPPPQVSSPKDVTPSYVDVAAGQVHVRRCGTGSGRPLVMLHGEWGSGKLLEPLMTQLAADRPVLAIDLPGHGESDSLAPKKPSLADYASTVIEVLGKLGIDAFDIYGRQMGAFVALEVTARAPGAEALVLEDLPLIPEADVADLRTNCAPAVEPAWDGSHLLIAWHMVRDRALYWPWYRRTRLAIRWREPDLAAADLQDRLVEFFKARHGYAAFCAAALWYDARAALKNNEARTLLLATPGDVFDGFATAAADLSLDAERAATPANTADHAEAISDFLAAST